jgi:hypothetical protein
MCVDCVWGLLCGLWILMCGLMCGLLPGLCILDFNVWGLCECYEIYLCESCGLFQLQLLLFQLYYCYVSGYREHSVQYSPDCFCILSVTIPCSVHEDINVPKCLFILSVCLPVVDSFLGRHYRRHRRSKEGETTISGYNLFTRQVQI